MQELSRKNPLNGALLKRYIVGESLDIRVLYNCSRCAEHRSKTVNAAFGILLEKTYTKKIGRDPQGEALPGLSSRAGPGAPR